MPVNFNNPTAYWKLDESLSTNNATDATGNGFTLTESGSPGTGTGILNGCRTFNGGSQFFSSTAAGLRVTSTFSASVWFKATNVLGTQYLLAQADVQVVSGPQFWLNANTLTASVQTNTLISATKSGVTASAWHLAVMVWDDTLKKLSLYYDGNNVANTTSSVTITGNTDAFVLGATFDSNAGESGFFNGSLDEVGWWLGYALTSSDVTTLYGGGTPPVFTPGSGFGGASSSNGAFLLAIL